MNSRVWRYFPVSGCRTIGPASRRGGDSSRQIGALSGLALLENVGSSTLAG
jgi:hypothetical protein